MADEYRIFWLSYGQQPPEGSTGTTVSGTEGGIMWVGEEDTFPTEAMLGKHLPNDPVFETSYVNRAATQDEIDAYEAMTTVSGA